MSTRAPDIIRELQSYLVISNLVVVDDDDDNDDEEQEVASFASISQKIL